MQCFPRVIKTLISIHGTKSHPLAPLGITLDAAGIDASLGQPGGISEHSQESFLSIARCSPSPPPQKNLDSHLLGNRGPAWNSEAGESDFTSKSVGWPPNSKSQGLLQLGDFQDAGICLSLPRHLAFCLGSASVSKHKLPLMTEAGWSSTRPPG